MLKRSAEPSSSHNIRIADRILPVSDPHAVPTVCADVITEWRVYDNTISLALGTIVLHPNAETGQDDPEVVVCARLRMPLGMALNIRNLMEKALKSPVSKTGTH